MSLPAVLAYHKVGTPELGGTWCTVRQLCGHLDALRRAGWEAIDLARFEARLDAAAGPPPAGRAAAGLTCVMIGADKACTRPRGRQVSLPARRAR